MTQEPAKAVAIRFEDAVLEIRELPGDTITRIARRNNTDWFMVMNSPARDLCVARDVIKPLPTCSAPNLPPLVTGAEVYAAVEKLFDLVNDDLPTMPEVESAS